MVSQCTKNDEDEEAQYGLEAKTASAEDVDEDETGNRLLIEHGHIGLRDCRDTTDERRVERAIRRDFDGIDYSAVLSR